MLSDDEKQILADWAKHPGAQVARRYIIELRKAEEAALGARLYNDASQFNPVEVANVAGRHKGRLEVLNHAWWAAKTIERQKAKEGTADDSD